MQFQSELLQGEAESKDMFSPKNIATRFDFRCDASPHQRPKPEPYHPAKHHNTALRLDFGPSLDSLLGSHEIPLSPYQAMTPRNLRQFYCSTDVQSEIGYNPSDMLVEPFSLEGKTVFEELAIQEFQSNHEDSHLYLPSAKIPIPSDFRASNSTEHKSGDFSHPSEKCESSLPKTLISRPRAQKPRK